MKYVLETVEPSPPKKPLRRKDRPFGKPLATAGDVLERDRVMRAVKTNDMPTGCVADA